MTYSIVARDPGTGHVGVASQAHYFGLGRVVPWAVAGVGVVATQSFVLPSYGPDGLAKMRAGTSAAQALKEAVDADAERGLRQVAMIDCAGDKAAFTGDRCVPCHGSVSSANAIALGNMLTGDGCYHAMIDAFEASTGALWDRMLDALDAAEAEGGDIRGRQSAAMKVVGGQVGATPWDNVLVDVRLDDHVAPLTEVRRLVGLDRANRVLAESVFTPGLLSGAAAVTGPELEAAVASLDAAQAAIGHDPEVTLWKGVLLLRAGELEPARIALAWVLARRPAMRSFLRGLAETGIVPAGYEAVLPDE
jgi:uncharacterized Ntn-hydrolase superfamily protein